MTQADAFLERIYDQALAQHRRRAGEEDAEARRMRLRGFLRDAIGSFPRSAGAEPVLLERVDCGSYVRERVLLSGVDGMDFAAYVLIPKMLNGRAPAVLAIHGHGYGSREIVGLKPDGSPDDGEPTCHCRFALPLVERGLIVIAPDVLGFGERRLAEDMDKDPRASSSCYKLSTSLLMYGKTLTGLRAAELAASLDYLASRADVDPHSIGAMGFSGGALLAWTCAALDERLRAVLLTGFPGTYKGTILSVFHCVDNFTPGMLAEAELPEWIGLLAPRPIFVESGSNDPIFPSTSAREAVAELELLYRRAGAEERLAWDVFPGVHEVSGRLAYDWLRTTLFALSDPVASDSSQS
ncbi:dienelactone hydrolase family protein [Cohnella sp. GCM10020058]|uniref:dienelactone hydrolase family protein n=1 Tax=Cohnella sp. GCM10020058 TaxID=3317330 RepID=UPI00363FED45